MATTPQTAPPLTHAHQPATPTPPETIIAALRALKAFEGLTHDEYLWLATHGIERKFPPGSLLSREGDPPVFMHIILSGEVHIRRSGNLAVKSARIGQIYGLLPFSRLKGYGGSGFAIDEVWLLDIPQELFPAMLEAIASMAQRSVSILLQRVREITRMEQQAEKLTALGKLAANLAHELNNPASAAQRAASSLFIEIRECLDSKYRLDSLERGEDRGEQPSSEHTQWLASTRTACNFTVPEDPLAASDREETLTQWLETHNVPQPWTIASTLAEARIPTTQLDQLVATVSPQILPVALATLASSLRLERMAQTVLDSTGRIFDLISAIKDYAYMDQAPLLDVDLSHSLDSTLIMCTSRLNRVTVERAYDPELPKVAVYGSELNQVWTALIDNALDAIALTGQPGTLRLAAHRFSNMACVEISDTGPGIDPSIASRIFEPFFTTTPVGSNLGLGLDTAQRIVSRHSGFIDFDSKPGFTCFQVRLPFEQLF